MKRREAGRKGRGGGRLLPGAEGIDPLALPTPQIFFFWGGGARTATGA